MRPAHKVALVLLATPFLSGCLLLRWLGFPVGDKVPYNPKAETGDTAVRKNVQFDDVPVPMGFELDKNNVFSIKAYTFRFGRFHYEGAWSYRKTASFYRQQMPISGWEHIQTTKGDVSQTQIYKKGMERCRVTISKEENISVMVQVYDTKDSGTQMAAK